MFTFPPARLCKTVKVTFGPSLPNLLPARRRVPTIFAEHIRARRAAGLPLHSPGRARRACAGNVEAPPRALPSVLF